MSNPVLHFLRRLRILEISVLSGAPLLGALLACDRLDRSALARMVVLIVLCGVGGVHVGIANDFFDTRLGHHRRPDLIPTPLGLPWIVVSGVCLLISIALGWFLDVVWLVLGIALCWLLYVAPPVRAKSIPVVSCILHFLAGSQHFALGYSALGGPRSEAALLMPFFGLIVVSGQVCHEIQHRELDEKLGIMTNARYFSSRFVFWGAMLLIVLSDLHLAVLSAFGRFPVAFAAAAMLVLPPYLLLWRQALRSGPSSERAGRFRRQYRLLYAALGAYYVLSLVIGRWP